MSLKVKINKKTTVTISVFSVTVKTHNALSKHVFLFWC